VSLSPGRQMGFETVVDQGLSQPDLDEIADRMTHVADRQSAKVELVEHERQIMILDRQMKEQAERRAKTVAMYQAEYAASSAGQAGRPFVMVKKQKADIDQIDQAIEELKTQKALRLQSMGKCWALIGRYAKPDTALDMQTAAD
jgi:thymidylate synthase